MPKFIRQMNRPPAFQWYGKDWLTSKKRAVMDLEQQGAYVNLLSHCWDTDDCSLPNDDTMLAALSELRDKWSDRSAPLKACFMEHPKRPGHITNLRLLEEFTKLLNYRREKQASGRIGGVKSGQSRRNVKGNHSEADLKLTLDSTSSKDEAKRTSSSSSSSSEETEHIRPPWRVNFQEFWMAYPKKRSKGSVEAWFLKTKPNEELMKTILEKLRLLCKSPDWIKDQGQFVPYPAKWLKNKGWEDDLLPTSPTTPRRILT